MTVFDIAYWVKLRKEADKAWERYSETQGFKERLKGIPGPLSSMVHTLGKELFIKGWMKGANATDRRSS